MHRLDAVDRADYQRVHLFTVTRWYVLAAALIAAVLLMWVGFRPDGLPFTPGARFSDAVTSHFPASLYFHDTIRQGDFPLWRETILAGHPFAANPLNKTAYPPQWLAALLPPLIYLNLMILLHGGIAFCGMLAWARASNIRNEAAVFAAFAYALSPRLIAHTGAGHLDVLYAMAWFPWLMFAMNRLFAFPDKLPSAILRLGLIGGLLILSDVRVSLFAGALAGGYALSLFLRDRSGKPLIGLAAAAICMFSLTLSVILPLMAWMPYLSRSGLTAGDASLFSLQPVQLIGLIFAPQTGNQETLIYVGLPVLILALVALLTQPRRHRFWIIAWVAALIYALGEYGGVWSALTSVFPVLLWFRVPARAWFIAALFLPFLAGHGLEILLERAGRRRLIFLIGGAGLLAGGIFALVGGAMPPGMAVGLLTGGALCLIIMLRQTGRLRPAQFAVIVFALAAVDLVHNGHQWMQWRGESEWITPSQIELAEALVDDSLAAPEAYQPGRIYSPTYTLEQQTAAVYDLRLFGGVDPFQIVAVSEAIREGGGIPSDSYSVVVPPLIGIEGDAIETANRDALPDVSILSRWGVTHVVSAYPLDVASLELAAQVDAGYIYVNRDPVLILPAHSVPAWAEDWTGLPDAAQVADNNRLTLVSSLISAAAFFGILIFYILSSRMGR